MWLQTRKRSLDGQHTMRNKQETACGASSPISTSAKYIPFIFPIKASARSSAAMTSFTRAPNRYSPSSTVTCTSYCCIQQNVYRESLGETTKCIQRVTRWDQQNEDGLTFLSSSATYTVHVKATLPSCSHPQLMYQRHLYGNYQGISKQDSNHTSVCTCFLSHSIHLNISLACKHFHFWAQRSFTISHISNTKQRHQTNNWVLSRVITSVKMLTLFPGYNWCNRKFIGSWIGMNFRSYNIASASLSFTRVTDPSRKVNPTMIPDLLWVYVAK